ncbi:hypothetical protein FQZ97_575870 [compost metagenome]
MVTSSAVVGSSAISSAGLHDSAIAICSPTGNTGLSEVIGSWKIIATSAPRTLRSVALSARARSITSPPRRRSCMLPLAILPPPCSTSRISASDVTDLPEPDSPTTASVSPRSTWNDRLRTASTVRSEVAKRTLRPSTETTRSGGRTMPEAEACDCAGVVATRYSLFAASAETCRCGVGQP